MTEHSHVISVLVENRFGVLSHVAGLFSSRGFNIDSLTVGETHDPSISRMTIVVTGDDRIIEQVNKQLNKLIDVVKVQDLTIDGEFIARELIMIKVNTTKETRSEILEIVDIFKANIVDISPKSLTIEKVDIRDRILDLIEILRPYGIKEIARTGLIALSKSPRSEK